MEHNFLNTAAEQNKALLTSCNLSICTTEELRCSSITISRMVFWQSLTRRSYISPLYKNIVILSQESISARQFWQNARNHLYSRSWLHTLLRTETLRHYRIWEQLPCVCLRVGGYVGNLIVAGYWRHTARASSQTPVRNNNRIHRHGTQCLGPVCTNQLILLHNIIHKTYSK